MAHQLANCDGSMKLELNGVQELAPDVSSEIQSIDSEQATHASANNDLKGTSRANTKWQ